MKIKGIFMAFFLVIGTISFSQIKFKRLDYKKIKRQIKKKNSDFYYPNLVKKYSRGLPMSIDEKRYFYYGFSLFKAYQPYKENKYYNKINSLIASKKYSTKSLQSLLNYVNLELADHPFDIKLLKIKIFVYKRLKDKSNYDITKKQIQVILDAIKSTGDGAKHNPYVVVFISNQYDILKMLNLKPFTNRYINKNLEFVKVKENDKKIKGIYFDITPISRVINSKKK
jgi:hypothetical protein